jgi:hypothetical protein
MLCPTFLSSFVPESEVTGLKRSEVIQCLNSGKEKISAALDGREGWQASYFSADRTFGDSKVETTVLVP